jgi:hypothetical protein
MTDYDLDLTITEIERSNQGAAWVSGTIDGAIRFQALVFEEHADCAEYELGLSRISKLWLQRIRDRKVVYNFDRGEDIKADSDYTQAIVEFLCAGIADLAFGQ